MLLQVLQVPWVGIEPTRPKSLDFESSASTNSATKASGAQKYKIIRLCFKAGVFFFLKSQKNNPHLPEKQVFNFIFPIYFPVFSLHLWPNMPLNR